MFHYLEEAPERGQNQARIGVLLLIHQVNNDVRRFFVGVLGLQKNHFHSVVLGVSVLTS